ncbi:MAG: hypothetical protein Q9227_009443 [Pyrenula ochraceoflavens]
MSNQGNDQKARESFASILSYYRHNRESLENVPGWVDRPESGSIIVGLNTGTVPSDEQTEEYKQYLRSLLATQEAINKLSDQEKQFLNAAANSSKARRKEGR